MKGILVKPDMIPAVVEGRKTQTRRVIKLSNYSHDAREHCIPHNGEAARYFGEPYLKVQYDPITDNAGTRIFPRYHAGETVYIKEAWMIEHNIKGCPKLDDLVTVHYSNASTSRRWGDIIDNEAGVFLISVAKAFDKSGYEQSPMFMPGVLARHFIKILAVRAERLQEIDIEDIRAEGIDVRLAPTGIDYLDPKAMQNKAEVDEFAELWDSINPKYPWDSNPFVWCYTFKKTP